MKTFEAITAAKHVNVGIADRFTIFSGSISSRAST